jgi:catechol 2,3-dioxygenase-like lactoylglutathione lyase family enzyme
MAEVRYIVDDVDAAVIFYQDHLGFELMQHFGPAMAIVEHGDLALWLAGPLASARKLMPDGARPQPGGWARIVIKVDDLAATVATMRAKGVQFRNEIVAGPGGKQILCLDPSGNLIELFEPA